MKNYVYKQNKGFLSKNQNLLIEAKTKFIIGKCIPNNKECNFGYSYYKCDDCYRLKVFWDNSLNVRVLKLLTSSCDYKIWVYLDKEYVYKDRGNLVIELGNVIRNEILIDLKIKKGTAITLCLEDSNCYKKIVVFEVK